MIEDENCPNHDLENKVEGINAEFDNQFVEGNPIKEILEKIAIRPDIFIKSQQIGEKDLSVVEKIDFLVMIFLKSPFSFLTRFGSYLTLDQLDVIERNLSNQSDVSFIIHQLKKNLAEKGNKCIVKNRRYGALLKLQDEKVYFSEIEMMKRNPLLYEQLIGKYLTEQEKKARDNANSTGVGENISLLSILMEGIDKRNVKDLLEKQREEEESQMEESEEDEMSENVESTMNNSFSEKIISKQWGEFSNENTNNIACKDSLDNSTLITATERSLLREEFCQEMYRSFLAGEDKDIDYNEIDSNVEFDCIWERKRDDEEKYFDSETPEDVNNDPKTELEVESEDELDVYMKHLYEHPSLRQNFPNPVE